MLVLIYIDDVLIVGQGKARVRAQARRVVEGAACGWREILGKRYSRTGCDSPLEAVACGTCNNFWGVRSGFVDLAWDIAPICRGSGPMCCGDPHTCSLPLSSYYAL